MPVMLWTADADGVWHHVNRCWAQYTGLTSETRGFGFEEALHPDGVAPTGARGSWTRGGQGLAWVGTCTDIEAQERAEGEALATREAALRALGLSLEARDRETRGQTDRVTAQVTGLGRALGLGHGELGALRLGPICTTWARWWCPTASCSSLAPNPRGAGGGADPLGRGRAAGGRAGLRAARRARAPPPRTLGRRGLSRRAGEDIPLLARLFTVVDVYDALLSERPYKWAWTPGEALAELRAQAGRQLDPRVVAAFLHLLED